MKCSSVGKGVHVDHLYFAPDTSNNNASKDKREVSKVKGVKVESVNVEGVKKLRNKESHRLLEKKSRDIKRDSLDELAEELGLPQDTKKPSRQAVLDQCIMYLASNKLAKDFTLSEPVSNEEPGGLLLKDKREQKNAAERRRRNKLSNAYHNLKKALHVNNGRKVSREIALKTCLTKIRLHKAALAMQKPLHGNDLVGGHHINKGRSADHDSASCSTIVYQGIGQGSYVNFQASGAVARNVNPDHKLDRTSPDIEEDVDVESYSSDSCGSVTDVSGIREHLSYLGSGAPNAHLYTETVSGEEFLQNSGSEFMDCAHQDALEDPFKLPPLLLHQDSLDWTSDDAMYDLPSPDGGIYGELSKLGVANPEHLATLSDLWSQDDDLGNIITPFCDGIPDNGL